MIRTALSLQSVNAFLLVQALDVVFMSIALLPGATVNINTRMLATI